jgi:hypothetical protein
LSSYSPKKHASKGNEAADEDGWGGRPDSIIGLLDLNAHDGNGFYDITV